MPLLQVSEYALPEPRSCKYARYALVELACQKIIMPANNVAQPLALSMSPQNDAHGRLPATAVRSCFL